MNSKIKELRKKAMALPLQPGVYIMKNKKKEIIYIGKAKALKNRVSQYFGSQNNHPEKVRRMVDNVDDFEYIITDSEFESLILECSLIKQHSPKYNILLKDDKGYSYIKVTNGEYGKLSYVLQKENDDATYIGPYKTSFYVKESVDEANKIFMLPTCSRKFPEDFGKQRPCLNYHIKQCIAPCTGKISVEEYNEHLSGALEFLKGGTAQTVKKLTEEMEKASEKLDFEKAAKYRDRIKGIRKMRDRQKVVGIKTDELDVITLAVDSLKGSFEVFRFEDFRLYDRENFIIDDIGDIDEARGEFLSRYYTMRDSIPKLILTDSDFEDREVIEEWLSDKKGRKVHITVPVKGTNKDLVDMCRKNAYESLAQQKGFTGKQLSVLEELKDMLGLEKIPAYIESYDISNISGSDNVAGMIVFENAKPNKSAYRRFMIKGFEGQDDYSSMKEVISRRFGEYLKSEDGENSGFSRLPDLILLDGGKGQVAVVKEVLDSMDMDVPVFGMVKDDRHRTRAITTDCAEIQIKPNQRVFSFVTNIQDEVHRFAVSYHHKRRKKGISSTLVSIDGIGEKRAKELMKYFRTLSKIRNATVEELEGCPSMTHDSALSVYKYFHDGDE